MANRHMKRCSISLLEKCKLKLQQGITSHQLEWLSLKRLQILNAEGGVEKREPSYTVGGNATQYSHYGEQCGDSLKKLEIELSYDPTIPLLGIHTKETRIEKDMGIPVFITALFIIARTWKQPRSPSADKWIRKLWYISQWNITQTLKRMHLNQF